MGRFRLWFRLVQVAYFFARPLIPNALVDCLGEFMHLLDEAASVSLRVIVGYSSHFRERRGL